MIQHENFPTKYRFRLKVLSALLSVACLHIKLDEAVRSSSACDSKATSGYCKKERCHIQVTASRDQRLGLHRLASAACADRTKNAREGDSGVGNICTL